MPTSPPVPFVKDPADRLDYSVDWSKWLNDGDMISTSTWTVPDGVTETDSSFAQTSATVWLAGGVDGTSVEVTNQVTTMGGRTANQSLTVNIRKK